MLHVSEDPLSGSLLTFKYMHHFPCRCPPPPVFAEIFVRVSGRRRQGYLCTQIRYCDARVRAFERMVPSFSVSLKTPPWESSWLKLCQEQRQRNYHKLCQNRTSAGLSCEQVLGMKYSGVGYKNDTKVLQCVCCRAFLCCDTPHKPAKNNY